MSDTDDGQFSMGRRLYKRNQDDSGDNVLCVCCSREIVDATLLFHFPPLHVGLVLEERRLTPIIIR